MIKIKKKNNSYGTLINMSLVSLVILNANSCRPVVQSHFLLKKADVFILSSDKNSGFYNDDTVRLDSSRYLLYINFVTKAKKIEKASTYPYSECCLMGSVNKIVNFKLGVISENEDTISLFESLQKFKQTVTIDVSTLNFFDGIDRSLDHSPVLAYSGVNSFVDSFNRKGINRNSNKAMLSGVAWSLNLRDLMLDLGSQSCDVFLFVQLDNGEIINSRRTYHVW